MSTVQGLRGKVKKLEINSSRYEINENGVEEINSLKANSVIYLNRKNRIIKQIDIYDNFTNEVKLNYSNGLLMNTISKKTNRIDKAEYKYNKRKKLIEYKDFQNDTLGLYSTYKYDSKDNPVLIEKTFFINGKKWRKDSIKNVYDYRKRTVKQYSLKEKYGNGGYNITYYNRKRNEINSESIDYLNNVRNSVVYEYDKWGNTTKQTNFNQNKKPTQILNYEYKYDKKKNITEIIKTISDKIVSKTIIKIEYW
tara:strand:- start:423 stop:1178 length:756 start_codon:yes stop_codon:yes gene_type:complete